LHDLYYHGVEFIDGVGEKNIQTAKERRLIILSYTTFDHNFPPHLEQSGKSDEM
jgi:hypothetical protein